MIGNDVLDRFHKRRAAKQDDHRKTEQASDQSGKAAIEPATSELDARRTLALDLERSYISSGVTDISTRVSGLNGTILNIEYRNLNDALVQKIMGVNSFAALLQKPVSQRLSLRAVIKRREPSRSKSLQDRTRHPKELHRKNQFHKQFDPNHNANMAVSREFRHLLFI
jgi:hypothetical protein